MSLISAEGRGVIVYLRENEARCRELLHETRMFAGQERAQTHATRGGETHDFIAAARILTSLGIRSVRLLANDSAGREALERYGVRVRECLNLGTSLPA
jgi:3,4-dihydroxy 2-butanone 4-phosphate synthase/GTP cyclohydrolase II